MFAELWDKLCARFMKIINRKPKIINKKPEIIYSTIKLDIMKTILKHEYMTQPELVTYFDYNCDIIENVHNKVELFDYIKQLIQTEYLKVVYMYNTKFVFTIYKDSSRVVEINFDPYIDIMYPIPKYYKSVKIYNIDGSYNPYTVFTYMRNVLMYNDNSYTKYLYFDSKYKLHMCYNDDDLSILIEDSKPDTIIYNSKYKIFITSDGKHGLKAVYVKYDPLDINTYGFIKYRKSDIIRTEGYFF